MYAFIYVFWCIDFVFLHIINGIYYVKMLRVVSLFCSGATMLRSSAITGFLCTIAPSYTVTHAQMVYVCVCVYSMRLVCGGIYSAHKHIEGIGDGTGREREMTMIF